MDILHLNASLSCLPTKAGFISEKHRLKKVFTQVYTQILQQRRLNPYMSTEGMHESCNVKEKKQCPFEIQQMLN